MLGPLLPTRTPCVRTSVIYGVTPEEGYLLFNLFVEVLPFQQPCRLQAPGLRDVAVCGPQVPVLSVSVGR